MLSLVKVTGDSELQLKSPKHGDNCPDLDTFFSLIPMLLLATCQASVLSDAQLGELRYDATHLQFSFQFPSGLQWDQAEHGATDLICGGNLKDR